MSSPLTATFNKGGISEMREDLNQKRANLIEGFPLLKDYMARVRTDPMLVKFFEERVTDVLF